MPNPFFIPLLKRLATEVGAEVIVDEPSQGGYLLLPDGRRSYFKRMSLSVNLVGASRVTGDKGLTLALLKKEGYRTPYGVQSDRIEVLENFVKENQGSFIVKPNSGSQAKGLSRINSLSELTTVFDKAKEFGSTVRVEEEIVGQHLSAGVAFGKVYFVYTKEPFSAGGMIVDIMDLVSEEVKNHLAQVTQLFNLNIASVDFIYSDDEKEVRSSKNCVIIEINSAPSFRKYGELGREQLSRVESLYRKILEYIKK
jgi:D-alanine-D-alanine ligase-like ATP-grasp enzyme